MFDSRWNGLVLQGPMVAAASELAGQVVEGGLEQGAAATLAGRAERERERSTRGGLGGLGGLLRQQRWGHLLCS